MLHNAALQSDYDLPGVFTDNAGGASVNGRWRTLPVEAKAYLLLAVVGLIGLLVRRRWVLVVFALFVGSTRDDLGARHAPPSTTLKPPSWPISRCRQGW